MGTHLLCLLPTQNKERTGKEWKGNEKLNTTICGGSELLYDKMERLIKSEISKMPADNKNYVCYNKDSNLFVGRSLQEE